MNTNNADKSSSWKNWIIKKLLSNDSTKEDIMIGYRRLKDKLGKPGVTDRASKDILDLIVQ